MLGLKLNHVSKRGHSSQWVKAKEHWHVVWWFNIKWQCFETIFMGVTGLVLIKIFYMTLIQNMCYLCCHHTIRNTRDFGSLYEFEVLQVSAWQFNKGTAPSSCAFIMPLKRWEAWSWKLNLITVMSVINNIPIAGAESAGKQRLWYFIPSWKVSPNF